MIEVENLTKFYGPVTALRQVNFSVDSGEIVGFLGPNGAGKTTALRILTCFMPPTSGTVRVAGLDCQEHPLKVRAKIGYLPETVPLYSDMTVFRFLAFVADAKGVPRSRRRGEIERVIEVCAISSVAQRIIGHLSKGFRQRVGIAQALLNNPPILILDEPTIGLDPAQIVEIRSLIKQLGGEQTIILSSHILPEVSQICQRILIINKGQIVATDTPANLTAQLQRNLQVFIEVEERGPEVAETLATVADVLEVRPVNGAGRYLIETKRGQDLRPELARTVVEHGWQLRELRLQDLSLEEIFMQLVTDEEAEEEQA
ncbi:MAG: ATP-binding cassette domain-containing protein [Deltaproteobacteria bacterium]|nr:MAG: ATP-binding cassette domain-containing protein [Deltaproteobacteria bacterium]